MCAAVGVVIELPQMHKFIDRASVGLEVPDELLVLPAPLGLLCRRLLTSALRSDGLSAGSITAPAGPLRP
jgi:hypothetical protein